MKKKPDDYSSVQKAIEILMAFTPHGQEMGTLELSRKIGIHKSTVSRLMGVLTYYDLLKHDHQSKKYSLGRAITDLGKAADRSIVNQLVIAAKPIMNELRDMFRESVSLEVISKSSVIIAAEAQGPPPVRVAFTANEQVPLHVAAGAKAILAFSSPKLVDSYINGKLEQFTPHTITDPIRFKKHLTKIAKEGVSFDLGEYNEDVHSVGAPIFDHHDKPVAAITVCSIARRMKSLIDADIVSHVKAAAAKISQKLSNPDDET